VVRTVLAALPLTHAGLLEPHGNRLAIRHRFHCHAVTLMKNRIALAAVVSRSMTLFCSRIIGTPKPPLFTEMIATCLGRG